MRQEEDAAELTERETPWFETFVATLISASLLLIPLVFTDSLAEQYRLPKLLLFRAAGAVLIGLMAVAWSRAELPPQSAETRRWLGLMILALAWVALSPVFATVPSAAWLAFFTVSAAMAFFLATHSLAARFPLGVLTLVFVVGAIQAILVVAQNAGFWFPILPTLERHAMTDPIILRIAPLGTLGNRNDAGMFLAAPALAAITLATVSTRYRKLAMTFALLLVAGLLATRTLTAVAALIASLLVFALLRSRRTAVIAIVTTLAAAVITAALYQPLQQRVFSISEAARRGDVDAILTNRTAAYLAAMSMIIDRPVTGVGGGNFALRYFDHRLRSFQRWPDAARAAVSEDNFGETHNDHLQLAAEYGIPGYLIAVLLLVVYARVSLRPAGATSERARFARAFALPHAVLIATLAAAQFPLQIATTLLLTALLAGLTTRWVTVDD